MSDLNLTSFNPLYPMRIHPYNELLNDSNVNIMDKVNAIIDYLNQVGKLTNDVVKDWNTVYQWVMNDGLTTDVSNKIEEMKANGELQSLLNTIFNALTGDMTTLHTTAKDTIVNALNEIDDLAKSNQTQLAQKATQADLIAYINGKTLTERPQRTRYFLFDSFYRADSSTSLGNAETNNTAYTLITTASPTPVWGISGNQATCVGTATTAGRSIAYQETNESDCIIECDLNVISDSNAGLVFRVTDINNFLQVTLQSGALTLAKYVSGAVSTIYTINRTFTAGKISIVLKGNKIEIYYDGFFITTQYDSFNSTATKHGLYCRGDAPNYRWANFSVKPVINGYNPTKMTEDFENGITKWYWSIESPNQSYSQTFNTNIKRSGNQSLRLELHSSDPDVNGSKRNELYLPSERPLEEHWYGVSIYLPNGGTEDFALDTSAEALIQWHASPDSGEQSVSPPLALMTKNGRYSFQQQYDANRMSSQSSPLTITNITTDLGDYTLDKGKWVDWVFHVKWGYQKAHEPLTEVYKNGILIYQDAANPNCYNDQTGIYPKVGIYKWDWHYGNPSLTTSRVVYYDNYFKK